MSNACWLAPDEQRETLDTLLQYPGLLKWDNERRLPLKSGGFTDVYVNLRDARGYPEANEYLAQLYLNPVVRLRPDRLAEVPDSVSCFAGPLSIKSRIPYITIREKPKEGRVAKATIIGNFRYGERITALDDVITDGTSKFPVWDECLANGLRLTKLVVLVDRQQGWRKKFDERGMKWDVWPGMTLHDVRGHLIRRGLMQRCSQTAEERNKIILALDKLSWEEILPIADELRPTGCILKVNDLARDAGGAWIVPNLSVYGRTMLDFKLHDIPNTVANDCLRIKQYAPWAITVHASGGKEMMQAAVKTLEGVPTKVLAVTVLTSLDENTCEEIYRRLPKEQVLALAALANEAGCHGLVCSPEEASFLKPQYPSMLIVTPGVRSLGVDTQDQKRIKTPAGAIEAGADYVVGGRQFLNAKNPVVEVKRVHEEELGVKLG